MFSFATSMTPGPNNIMLLSSGTDISKSLDDLNIAIDTNKSLTISEAEYFLTAKLDIDSICIDDIVLVDSVDNCYNILKMAV